MELRLFDTRESPEQAGRYLAGQRRAYAVYGVDSLAEPSWLAAPAGTVFAVGAYQEDGIMVGGTRVHLRTALTPLPIERCVQEPLLNALILSQLVDVPAEFCGVWVDREFARSGVADFVFLGAVVACRVLGSKLAYGFAHKKVVPFYQKYGLHFDTTHSYTYPDERYVSYAAQVDLGWPAKANHPACGTYRVIQRAFAAGLAFEFKPGRALDWEPPLAEVTPWLSALPLRGGPLPTTSSVQNRADFHLSTRSAP